MDITFPVSFDQFTLGHGDIVRRALNIFDKVIIAVGENIEKRTLLTAEKRVELICDIFNAEPRVEVILYQGLTVNLCYKLQINNALGGLRSSVDFEYESTIESINRVLYPDIKTVILLTTPQMAPISSSAVRDIYKHGGNLEKFGIAV